MITLSKQVNRIRTYVDAMPVRDAPNAQGIVRTRYQPMLSGYEVNIIWRSDMIVSTISEAIRSANIARNVRINSGVDIA